MRFREEPVTPVYRHWMCEQVGCNGELLSTGEGITRLSTRWKHRCGKCGHEDWADATYPRVAYLLIDAIGRLLYLKSSLKGGCDLVSSIARPGGNMTGINFLGAELAARRLGLFRALRWIPHTRLTSLFIIQRGPGCAACDL
jgi:hypothetical protein